MRHHPPMPCWPHVDLRTVEEFGRASLIDVLSATSEQVATICYTSGTTGQPKGVVLTHGALAQAAHGFMYQFNMDQETTLISFLPLAHIYQAGIQNVYVLECKLTSVLDP